MMVPKLEDELENLTAGVVVDDSNSAEKPNLKGDWLNFFLLLLLYTMQGVPFGLALVMPIILQSKKNVSYKDQAIFSLVAWPESLKLIWAPLIDSLYVHKMGRRKSWLIPVQYLMGACFIYMASNIDEWLPETRKPDILKLVYAFFFMGMLTATLDIVVDGWSLTMLKRNNVGYASTCNSTGLVMGIMISYIFSVLLTSEDFSNKYLRIMPDVGGVFTLKSLLYAWGVLFTLITTLIAIFKKEKDNRLEDDHVKFNIVQNYSLIGDILKLPGIQLLALTLLTSKIGFAATDSLAILKLIDAGVPKDNIMFIHTPLFVVKMFLPLVVAKYTSGPKPMNVYLTATPFRLLLNISFGVLIYYTPTLIITNGFVNIPKYYYALLIFILSIHDILDNIMRVALLSFFSRISDSRFGGTYMSLLGTLLSLGGAWSSSVTIGMVDFLTFKQCSLDHYNSCSTANLKNICKTIGGDCVVIVNGYYVETAMCTIIGIIWFCVFRKIIKNVQTKGRSYWLVDIKRPRK
ncbi:acetyl-coenzyme A transporter 1 isoform X1 [Acyrthosiphon pisum]|uniref:Acetyl-coenzyme A transporter 1 n=1 Tax=Acyrthosiphon pisum TaxID=7029 RepID=A0A8R1W1U2_ACYPI|nr:acetyl-coenzyme A transporter 1 isoform X1 [Acyrthosiphon pisum]|eukprot:XP_001949436.2 PREDICTED: acetyl-coenzyme A transporter 1 isoform X1 [Acyrthosiphon pisum]